MVVNLAGAPTAGNPHSKKWARELRESRVTTTRRAGPGDRRAPTGSRRSWPATASPGTATTAPRSLTEESDSRGDSLLTRVTREWQEAADPAVEAGARVCVLRTSPVMDRRSEPLRQLRLLFRLGLGARLGDGEQYMPMISLRDWVGGVAHLAEHDTARGPFNLSCPRDPDQRRVHAGAGGGAAPSRARRRPDGAAEGRPPVRWRPSCSARSTCAPPPWSRPATGSATATWPPCSPPGSA